MYKGGDPGEMTEPEKRAHTERDLRDNLDVLFRLYRQDRLHMLVFRTTHLVEWINVIQSRVTTNHSFQLTKRRGVNNLFTITLSGSQEQLDSFCADFDQLYDEVMKSVQDGGAAAQRNPEDDVEELRQRIRELELENGKLRKK